MLSHQYPAVVLLHFSASSARQWEPLNAHRALAAPTERLIADRRDPSYAAC